uniref:Leucine-rich repeat-containing protein 71 n=1 Tax=Ciona intestinalis TaxID=7719 RepID=H2XUT3_CIOIN
EPYTCTGNFPDDFAELWQRSGLDKEHVPVVKPRAKRPATPTADDAKTTPVNDQKEKNYGCFALAQNGFTNRYHKNVTVRQVEFDVEDTKQMQINHAKELFIRSWKVEEKVLGILKMCILERLQCINLWNVGLTEHTLKILSSLLPSLPSIKSLVLDGNPIPGSEPYYLVMGEDSPIQHLSLRNNQITDQGAEMIGKALGTTFTQNRCLATLNLSFNNISDAGAKHIAQGIRMNRVLLSLSLASNNISDEGCQYICNALQRFSLTHEEVVQRRKLLSQGGFRGGSGLGSRRTDSKDRPSSNRSGSQMRTSRGSSKKKPDAGKKDAEKTPKKDEKGKKGEIKQKKGISRKKTVVKIEKMSVTSETPKGTKGKKSGGAGGKDGGKRAMTLSVTQDSENPDLPEFVHPLMDHQAEHTEGKVFIPGCMTLVNLNLSRNKIGKQGMEYLLSMIQYQANRHRILAATPTAPGLLKLHIQRNAVSEQHPTYVKIQETMVTRDPTYKPEAKTPEDDIQSV